eukprot:gene51904-63465_t
MDNHYVPNLTFGPMICQALKPHAKKADGTAVPIDVHLMIQPVDALAAAFADAGADLISFHPDATGHVHRSIQAIKAKGCKAGLVFNPAAPMDVLDWVIDDIDLILIMSVNPGFGGQGFIDSALRKIEDARKRIDASGKDIRLEIRGADTELDKSVIDKLADPLTHLVRNSVDHGIEMPHERIAAGKPAHGTLTLSAQHAGGCILIQVRDDGRGLDRERILAKARGNGMVLPENITDAEVWQLIFAPGFSTAEIVTEVSGRGVGMDVVKRNILALDH